MLERCVDVALEGMVSGGLGSAEEELDLMFLDVCSHLHDSMIP